MMESVSLIMLDDEPTFVLLDGTIIDPKQVGWISRSYLTGCEDSFLEPITKSDIDFILNNEIDCEIEMVTDCGSQKDYDDMEFYDAEKKPKLYKGKVIIHLK